MPTAHYMTVKHGSALYKDYFKWIDSLDIIDETYKKIADKYGIKTKEFYLDKESFVIVPTSEDKKKFNKFLRKDGKSFRKNCAISKEWVDAVKDIKYMRKPTPVFYADIMGRCYTQLFHVGETLYCSIEPTEYDMREFPEWGESIKASEFYQVIEDMTKGE